MKDYIFEMGDALRLLDIEGEYRPGVYGWDRTLQFKWQCLEMTLYMLEGDDCPWLVVLVPGKYQPYETYPLTHETYSDDWHVFTDFSDTLRVKKYFKGLSGLNSVIDYCRAFVALLISLKDNVFKVIDDNTQGSLNIWYSLHGLNLQLEQTDEFLGIWEEFLKFYNHQHQTDAVMKQYKDDKEWEKEFSRKYLKRIYKNNIWKNPKVLLKMMRELYHCEK